METANLNAAKNGFTQVSALVSDLFSALPPDRKFDVIISSPPSFSGEPRDNADRAWHAGPGYRDILSLFDQAGRRLEPDGKMYLLLSSDTNLPLMQSLMDAAVFTAKMVAQRSIWIEAFYLYELSLTRQQTNEGQPPTLADPSTASGG